MDVTGKIAIVTGGACNIGRGVVLTLAKHGANVVIADIDGQGIANTAREVERMGRQALAIETDVTDLKSIDLMVESTLVHFRQIDILVNNAGVIAARGWEARQESAEADWDITYSINVKGIVKVTNAVALHMKERRYGKIINIASVAGRQATIINPAYAASKAATINFTRTSAVSLAPYNINVNAICPGLLWTPMWEKLAQKHALVYPELRGMSPLQVFDRMVERRIPLRRPQVPEDIGNLATFLASEVAANITGQSINVDGGSRTD